MIRAGNWKQARSLVSSLALPEDAAPRLHYLVGVVLWQQQDKIGAIRRFRTAERLGLRASYLHKALGVAYYEAHQFLLFRQQMERAIAADGSDPQPHYYLGSYRVSVHGDFAGALRHFEEVLELAPDHSRGHAYLAYCLERMDRPKAAADHYRRAVQLLEFSSECSSRPYRGLARLALESQPEAAVEWAQRAVEAEPQDYEAHALLARAHERTGGLAAAVAAAAEAIRLNPDHAASHYLIFTVHRRLGNAEEARRHLARFQEIKQAYGDQ